MPRAALAESAVSDIEGILAWYADEGVPDVGRRFVTEIFERLEALSIHPEMGRIVPEFGVAHLRELIHPPFRIVYRYDSGRKSDVLEIVRIWRTERLL